MEEIRGDQKRDDPKREQVGKTLWDILSKIFAGNPRIVILVIVGLVVIFLLLVLTGILKFEVNEGKVSMRFTRQNAFAASSSVRPDDLIGFCIKNGIALKKKYVITSVTHMLDIEFVGKHRDSTLYKERIVYDVLALEDISGEDKVFKEDYFGDPAAKGLRNMRWFGTDNERLISEDETAYFVHFNCKKGETHTIITGNDEYEKGAGIPIEYYLRYPNDDDVIGKLTMLISTHDFKFRTILKSAVRIIKNGQEIRQNEQDAFYNQDENQYSSNVSVSYSWTKILPGEELYLVIK